MTSLLLPIIKRHSVAAETAQVVFERNIGAFPFRAGQYMRVSLPGVASTNVRDIMHDFSIASSPNSERELSIAFRVSQSRFKQTILTIPLGSVAQVEGPFGIFTLPEACKQPCVFVAGGIGVTPFLSMSTFAAEEGLPCRISLISVNRDRESAAFSEELRLLEKRNPNFSLDEKFGLLEASFLAAHVEKSPGARWYIAGPLAMTRLARQMLSSLGVPEASILTEEFSGYDMSNTPHYGHATTE